MTAAVMILCAGCATGHKAQPRPVTDWERPGEPLRPLSLLATQGFPNPTISSASTNQRTAAAPQPANPAPTQPAPHQGSFSNGSPIPVLKPLPSALVSLRDWCKSASLPEPVAMQTDQPGFSLKSSRGILSLTVGSKVARWQGMEVHLGFPPELIHRALYVQSADLKSTIAPLLRPAALGLGPESVIVLDPGHGGQDSGTRSVRGGVEKDFTLDWARRLQALLTKDGWQVWVTRTDDHEVALSNRVVFAESAGAGLFLSLHFNSAAPDKAGIETYCLTPAGVPSTLTRGYADELDLSLPNNDYDAQNLQIAVMLHKALLAVNGGRDRGVRRARFPTVLRGQKCPAVLIEGGYLSNSTEARLVADPAHRQKLAEAIAATLRPFAPGRVATTNSVPPAVAAPEG